ncbi:MAG: UbiA prenyltransferase family protein [Alphaproteobacteria bacterium]|nr:UbiA prenyltransferase family protein [Alphaproteobacteria bacterium]
MAKTYSGGRSLNSLIRSHVEIARPDHWFKNIFMLPGAALAAILTPDPITEATLVHLLIGIAATCLVASANYTINEWLDSEFDRHHPNKRHRPSVLGHVSAPLVYVQWAVLAFAGLALSAFLSQQFFFFAIALLAMGVVYNVRPLRTKDRQYLDVLTESVNNPLRFMLGWAAIVSDILPPSSVLLAYWMGGAYLMAVKRYAELRFIGDADRAGLYRRSFNFYTEQTLLLSALFYAISSAFFLGVFLIKYRIELLLAIPFLALLFVWYLRIGMRPDSVTQRPEKLYTEKKFVLYVAFLAILIVTLFIVDLPWLNFFVEHRLLRTG